MALKVRNVRESFEDESVRRIKMLVAGQPGAGKTRTASTWPNVLYADVEGRLLSVRDRDVHSVEIASIADLDELRSNLAQSPQVREKVLGIRVDTIVIDTVDEVARLVIKERLRSEKQETMRMADWGYLGDTLRSLLRGYRNLDLNVLLNVHLKAESDSETGRTWEKPAIQGQVGDEIAAYVDLSVLMVARPTVDVKTGERILQRHLQTYPDSAHGWIKDHSGTLPLEFPINFNDDYERLAALIFGARPSPDAPVASPVASAVMSSSVTVDPVPARTVDPVPPRPGRGDQVVQAGGRMLRTAVPPAIPTVDVGLPEPAAEIPESVPVSGTEPDLLSGLGGAEPEPQASGVAVCDECGTPVTNKDQVDISRARFKVPLCREHFAARKSRRK